MLLLVAMLFSIMPTAVFAETGSASATTTAYVTIVNQGNFVVMHKEVPIVDYNDNGILDIDDALYATHDIYYPGGAESGYSSYIHDEYGLSLGKLWGDSSGNFGYNVNNAIAWNLSDTVENGDHVVAFTPYATYSYFNTDKLTTSSSSINLELFYSGYEGWNPVEMPISNADIIVDGMLTGQKTTTSGAVTLSFKNEGTYIVSATTESMILVPPICVVTYDTNYVADDEHDENQGNEGSGDSEGITESATIKDIPDLMENIAKGYVNAENKWNVMDMGTYSKLNGAQYSLSDVAKQKYVNTVIKNTLNGNYDEDNGYGSDQQNYSTEVILPLTSIGINAMFLYPENSNTALDPLTKLENTTPYISEWVTPYTLMAYNQGYGAGSNENELLSDLLALQNEDGGFGAWGSSVDSVGETLAALSFYQNKEEVRVAIDKAVTYLSNQIHEDGVYTDGWNGYNANSTAMAVIGLAAVYDKYDETITRLFEKSVQGLLSFAVNDNTGFWKAPNTTVVNAKATEQGFRALIAASQVMKTGQAFNVYDFSGNTLNPGYEKEIGSSSGSGGSYVPKDDKITVKVSIKAIDGYWMQNKSVTLEKGATASDALLKAIKGTGITQEGAEDDYIESMEYNGVELGEFTHGDYSGWMYKVNGTAPNVGVTSYVLSDSDGILFYFTEDYTKESMDEEKDKDKEEKESDKITTTPVTEVFGDVSNHWASEAIQYVYDNGILRGVSDSEFAPEATFSRAMIAAVLHRLAGSPDFSWSYPFKDVSDITWYAGPVAWAHQNQLIGGMTETTYAPENPITREQLAVMLMRYAAYCGYDTTTTVALNRYADANSVSDYAQTAMQWAVSIGLIHGRTADTLAPQGTATRAEVSVMLERFMKLYQPVETNEDTK